MIGIPLGILYTNATEWLVHKHLLHGLGRNKDSFWAFHWHDHHKTSRRHEMRDDKYTHSLWSRLRAGDVNSQVKEAAALLGAALLHAPLLPVAPFFTLTVWACAANYYRVHRKSHLDPQWAAQHVPWHVDHHLARNQDANWCVTFPIIDVLVGTRERYVGTTEHAADLERRAQRKKAERDAQSSAAPVTASSSSPSSTPSPTPVPSSA
jgi:sterol desaturase/sphingolipid hydroxylase (fatty acid hydroxylase superfamily)